MTTDAGVNEDLVERPNGAIHNGQTLMDRLENHYDFVCEGGPLRNCGDWLDLKRCFQALADYALSALPPVRVPEGFCLVPVEPTSEMTEAAHAASLASSETMPPDFPWINTVIYRAMLAAAPPPPGSTPPREPDDLVEALEWFVKRRPAITADVFSAHSGRGEGASEWMREDDFDFRKELREAFNRAETALTKATGGAND